MKRLYLKEIKYSVEDKLIKPDFFFLIPELIVNSGFQLKASSGFDAIAQGVESILSIKSNEQSLKYSEKSLTFSFKNYEVQIEFKQKFINQRGKNSSFFRIYKTYNRNSF